MAKTIRTITVKSVDNELRMSAYSWATSIELVHMKAGNFNGDGNVVTISGILPAGTWTLLVEGINWGGPAKFDLTIAYTDGTTKHIVSGVSPVPAGATNIPQAAGTTGTVVTNPTTPQGGITMTYQEVFLA